MIKTVKVIIYGWAVLNLKLVICLEPKMKVVHPCLSVCEEVSATIMTSCGDIKDYCKIDTQPD